MKTETKFSLNFKAALFTIFVLLAFSSTVWATTYFVDSNGAGCSSPTDNDYNPITASCGSGSYTVFDSIQRAADYVSNGGDIVEIRAGTYGRTVFDIHSGRKNNRIIFRAYNGESVKVSTSYWLTIEIRVSWIKIEGLIVKNNYSQGHHVRILKGSNNWIYNCEVDGSSTVGKYGLTISNDEDNVNIDNNVFENCTVHDLSGEGIYFHYHTGRTASMYNNQIINNTVYNCAEGIQNTHELAGSNPAPSGTIISGNTIYKNGGQWGTLALAGDDLLVENNIIHDNTCSASGIYFENPGGTTTIRNNVLWNNNGNHPNDAAIWITGYGGASGIINIYNNTIFRQDGDGIFLASNATGARINVQNNIISYSTDDAIVNYAGANDDYNLCYNNSGSDCSQKNDQNGDPKFVSTSSGSEDFHLRSDSPCIDKGKDIGLSFSGSAPDIGAFEFEDGGKSASPSPPTGLRIVTNSSQY